MQLVRQSASNARFTAGHDTFQSDNPQLVMPRRQQQRGPSYMLNGDRIYDPRVVFEKAKKLGPVVVQFVSKSGRAEEPRPCANLLAIAAAIPTEFKGGYVVMRAKTPPTPEYRPARLPSLKTTTPSARFYSW